VGARTLDGLSKDRLLEIYLNIIEWGPDVHGANEAARYYFAKDASELSLDEALFLTVVIPSPSRWRTRVDAYGELRPWARSQMAYIARKMADHQWLAPEQVPADSTLHVTLRGRAADLIAPRAGRCSGQHRRLAPVLEQRFARRRPRAAFSTER
jgi:membrane peptidoglycan carboxypeptidase